MILWLTGNSGAGKTTLARQLKEQGQVIILDGDEIRDIFRNKDLSKEGRWEHNLKVARLAKNLDEQGFNVVVSVIAPYKELRDEIQKICGCFFIYLYKKPKGKNYPYELEDKFYFTQWQKQ